jgi:hypothetical protein
LEIHAPEKPVLTIKEASVHLLIVTVGILIALSLEGIVEYVHHRTIVREAREIMREEIEQNSKELDQALAHIKAQGTFLTTGIDYAQSVARGETPAIPLEALSHMLDYRTAKLHTAAHATAELMGAFSFMDYKEVSRYAAVYDSQSDFVRVQAAAFVPGLSAFSYGIHRDFAKAPASELQAIADKLREALGSLVLAGQTGKELHDQYTKVLAGN